MKSNILDRAVSWVAPEAGFKRARARAAAALLNGEVRRYDAARNDHRTGGWTTTSSGSANAEIVPQAPRIRERSRDLVRNNPYAAKAVNVLVNNMVGDGIVPEAKTGTERQQAATEQVWNDWTEVCDADGQLDFYGLEALAARTVVESGECLIRLRTRRMSDGLPVPLQLQVLEPDFLDTSRQERLQNGRYTVDGIQFDMLGRRTGYWLYDRHPGDTNAIVAASITSRLVPADEVLHLFDKLRPGQNRGVPWFAPTVLKIWDLSSYDEAELIRKRIEACMALFVTQEDDPAVRSVARITTETDSDGNTIRREAVEPGMIEYLKAGESVEGFTPQSAGGYGEYMSVQLHAIAAGIGVTYEQLTGDLSMVNYSSYRAGHLEFRSLVQRQRWNLLVMGMCKPVWRRFLSYGAASGALQRDDIRADWIYPPWQSIDPEKEANAELLELRSGGLTLRDYLTRKGIDFQDWLEEMAETLKALDDKGIILDSDSRHRTRNGNAIGAKNDGTNTQDG